MNAADYIRAGLEHLEGGKKWWKRGSGNDDGSCMVTVFQPYIYGNKHPLPNESLWTVIHSLIRDVCAEEYPDRFDGCSIWSVNDHPDTTFDDVELIMTKAALRAEEKGN